MLPASVVPPPHLHGDIMTRRRHSSASITGSERQLATSETFAAQGARIALQTMILSKWCRRKLAKHADVSSCLGYPIPSPFASSSTTSARISRRKDLECQVLSSLLPVGAEHHRDTAPRGNPAEFRGDSELLCLPSASGVLIRSCILLPHTYTVASAHTSRTFLGLCDHQSPCRMFHDAMHARSRTIAITSCPVTARQNSSTQYCT